MLLDLPVRHALLLQGPVGPFFRRFATDLERWGITVTKVNFNAGDSLFYRRGGVHCYRGALDAWPDTLRRLIDREGIDGIFLFGDCRPVHREAIAVARSVGVRVWVFEEGYLRPDFVTLEEGGVNGNSSLPRDPEFYRRAVAGLPELPATRPVGRVFRYQALYAVLHSVAQTLLFWRYPHYRHHRKVNCFRELACWSRGLVRKIWYGLRERGVLARVQGELSGRYFFVPLQVHCDAQIAHSPFASIEAFVGEVIETFARAAPADALLVLKHHPHDRPYRDYGRLIRRIGERCGCADRLIYVHDVHLPTLLRNTRGTVTMNSTVGISSLHHGAPVKVLGTAVYDVPGLTATAPLEGFFANPGEVDAQLYEAFCRWLREDNQVNGSFYKRLPGSDTASGVALVASVAAPNRGKGVEGDRPVAALGKSSSLPQ